MKDEDFYQELSQHKKTIKLIQGRPFILDKTLRYTYYTANEALAEAQKIIQESEHQKVPMHFIALPASGVRPPTYNGSNSILQFFLRDIRYKRALNLLLEKGLNLWLRDIDADAPMPQATATYWLEMDKVTFGIFPESKNHKEHGLYYREHYLKAALKPLDKMPETESKKCLGGILKRFENSLKNVALNRPGLLGVEDHNALMNASIFVKFEAELRQKCDAYGISPLEVEPLFETAKKVIDIKGAAAQEVFNPETFKKKLTKDQLERMKSLNYVQAKCLNDPGMVTITLDATPWIVDNPQVLALLLKGKSFVHEALLCGNSASIDWIEKSGANVWLAAAQHSQDNVMEWFSNGLVERFEYRPSDPMIKKVKEELPQWARIIAYGAHLNGEKEPVDSALKKLDQTMSQLSSSTHVKYGGAVLGDTLKDILQELRAYMEGLIMEELLTKVKGASTEHEAGASAQGDVAPIKKRQRL